MVLTNLPLQRVKQEVLDLPPITLAVARTERAQHQHPFIIRTDLSAVGIRRKLANDIERWKVEVTTRSTIQLEDALGHALRQPLFGTDPLVPPIRGVDRGTDLLEVERKR